MESIIVIVIVGIAAVYVARNFYRKFKRGKSYDASSGCSGCGGADTCGHKGIDGHPAQDCTINDDISQT
jgi:hypothetical protein